MENRTKLLAAVAECIALAIGLELYHFGFIAWYVVPFSLLVPPAFVAVALIASIAAAARNGDNPFQ